MKRFLVFHRFFAVLALLLGPVPAYATNRTVTNLNDSGSGSLRDTIAQSVNGDTINFSVTGTITLTSGELGVGRNITITGPGAGSLTVTRASNAATLFRIFHISNSTQTGPTVSMSGLTISGGNAQNDGVYKGGGGILNEFSILTLTNCVIENNTDTTTGINRFGGGIFNDGYDTATNGNGTGSASLTLVNCTIRGNTIAYEGGGIGSYGNFNGNTSLTMTNCTVSGNHGSGSSEIVGGGMRFLVGKCTIINSTFSGNIGSFGAAISFGDNGDQRTIVNCTISGNGDSGTSSAGGIFNGGFTILNTIVAGNTGGVPDVDDAGTIVFSEGHNFIGKTDGSHGWVASDYTGTSGAPLDPQLGPLQDNGGPTQTMAPAPGSAVLDAADDSVLNAPWNLTTDQRGNNFPRKVGAHVDVGAYERDVAQTPNLFTVTKLDDHDDGVCGVVDCTLREAINACVAYGGSGSGIQFDDTVRGTITLTSDLPPLSVYLAIQGPGARSLAISGNNAHRIFVTANSFPGGITISGLTIRDARLSNSLFTGTTFQGAAIFYGNTTAFLTVNDCAILNNSTQGSPSFPIGSGGSGLGGAVFNFGAAVFNRCTFSGNNASGGSGADLFSRAGPGSGGSGLGAAVYNDAGGTLYLNDCTISGNSASGGHGGNGGSSFPGGNGGSATGAVFSQGTLHVNRCTISGNSATAGAPGTGTSPGNPGIAVGGLTNSGAGTANPVTNTIVAANTATGGGVDPDVSGTFVSSGFNLIGNGGGSSGFTAGSDQVGSNMSPINPRLGPLQNNDGPTDTMLPLMIPPTFSPAIDKGNSGGAFLDQRGHLRRVDSPVIPNVTGGDGADIGAVEFIPLTGVDSDGDGMSDQFEYFYGFNPANPADGSQDSDGDGLTNAQEYQAGTNPFDANSGLRIVSISQNGANNLLVYASVIVLGKNYLLERKDALTDSMWTPLVQFSPPHTGEFGFTDVGGATPPHHFYRVRLLP